MKTFKELAEWKKLKIEPTDFMKAAKEARMRGDLVTAKHYEAEFNRLKTYEDKNVNEKRYIVNKIEKGDHKAVTYKDPEWNEYQTEFHIKGVHQKEATHHTDDKDDAIGTATHWVNKQNESLDEMKPYASSPSPSAEDIEHKKQSAKAAARAETSKNPTDKARNLAQVRLHLAAIKVKESKDLDEGVYDDIISKAKSQVGTQPSGQSARADIKTANRYGVGEKPETWKVEPVVKKGTTLVHSATGQKEFHPDVATAKKAWASKSNFGHYTLESIDAEGVAEGAPELLKAEMPLVRHIEKELTNAGLKKDDTHYNKAFGASLQYYRKFGHPRLGENIQESYYNEGLMHMKSEADRAGDKAFRHSNDLDIDDGSDSKDHLEGIRLHKLAADKHQRHADAATHHIKETIENITAAGSMDDEHMENHADRLKYHLLEKNDSERQIDKHKEEIEHHLNQVTESEEINVELKSLREWIKPSSEILKDIKDKEGKAKTVHTKTFQDQADDIAVDTIPKPTKGTGKEIADKFIGRAKDLSSVERRRLVQSGKITTHKMAEDIEYDIIKLDSNTFIAEFKDENDEVVFECSAPTIHGAIVQMERAIESVLQEKTSKKPRNKSSAAVAKRYAGRKMVNWKGVQGNKWPGYNRKAHPPA